MERISEDVLLKGKRLKFCNGEGILVIRKGDAGNVRYLPKDNYTINDDAYITIGSVVVSNVPLGAHVTGNFAVEHNKFMVNQLNILR